MEKAIYFFYIFFQGTLFLQAAIFLVLYRTSRKRELLYYSLFLLLIAINFLISDPSTFGLGEDEVVLNSNWFKLMNTPLVVIANVFYVLFLKEFYRTLTRNRLFFSILRYTNFSLLGALALFFFLFTLGIHSNLLFNIINLLGAVVGIWLVSIIIRERMPFTKLMAYGFISNLVGTFISVCMLMLLTQGVKHLLVSEYPFTFIKLGLLTEIFFFNLAILKKWHRQEKELENQQLKTELAVEKIKSQISKDLHDEIGSTLSGINLYSHMAQQQNTAGNQLEAANALSIIQEATGEVIGQLKDMVWSIQPGSDSLLAILDRVKEYAVFMAGSKGITVKIDFQHISADLKPATEQRHHIFMIAKETINNAVKHSGGSLIEITAVYSNEMLTLTIQDNGDGFEVGAATGGNGLRNMQKRAEEMGGSLQLNSSLGNGTEWELKLKITQRGIA